MWEIWGDVAWGDGYRTISSAQPTLPEPAVDEPREPSADDEHDWTQYLGLPAITDAWGEGFVSIVSAKPHIPEPTVDEPPPEPAADDEDDDASYSKENECYNVNCKTPDTSPDKENECFNVNGETPGSSIGSSKSSLTFATVLTPTSERQVDVYTECVALHAGQHCHTNHGRYNHLCFPISDAEFRELGHRSTRTREPLGVLSPPRVVGAYMGRTPERAASAAGNTEFYALASFLKAPRPLEPHEERQLLRTYGYRGISRATNRFSDPLLSISLAHHFERAGHTWYELKCSLRPERTAGKTDGIVWAVHRRLAMLRGDLHGRIKMVLGKVLYREIFEDNHFPSRGGLPGTSARLKKWLAKLVGWVNSGQAPSVLIAHVLKFLELPSLDGTRIFFDIHPTRLEFDLDGKETGARRGKKKKHSPRHAARGGETTHGWRSPAARQRATQTNKHAISRPGVQPAAASLSRRLFPDDE